jgi:acetoin utilization deacetylase AcuC-like enzyme
MLPMPVPVIRSDAHLGHDGLVEFLHGEVVPCFEAPARAIEIERALTEDGAYRFEDPTDHGEGPILAVHDRALLEVLAGAWNEALMAGLTDGVRPVIPGTFLTTAYAAGHGTGLPGPGHRLAAYTFDTATPLVAGTYRAARAAVDVALTAMDLVGGGARVAYALCRPPGHHAGRALYGGYCFFNNAAIVAQALVAGGAYRVAILDVDYHHGNGTQQLFWDRHDVLYVSLHGDPARAYPYFSGHPTERGFGAGEGATLNIPLPERTKGDAYLAALATGLDAIRAFDTDAPLVVSLGFDTFEHDPIADMALTTDDYRRIGAAIAELDLPTIVIQEGGYALDAIGANAVSFLAGLRGA